MQELLSAGRYFYCFILLLSKKWNRCFFNLSIIASMVGKCKILERDGGAQKGPSVLPVKKVDSNIVTPDTFFLICNLTKAEENIYLLSHKCTYIPMQLPPWIPRKCNFCCCFMD